jgi:hypothetical protein
MTGFKVRERRAAFEGTFSRGSRRDLRIAFEEASEIPMALWATYKVDARFGRG